MARRKNNRKIPAKTPEQLEKMAAAGAIVGHALHEVRAAAREGMSTLELDRIAETVIRDHGATPTFLGYEGFPASICASVNDAIVHGIPNAETILQPGDLVSIDCGATYNGWVGDSALSFGIGELDDATSALNEATAWVLRQGIEAMVPGNRLTDISHALEMATRAAEKKFNVELFIVDGYGGHGIGRTMHEDPFLANEGRGNRGPLIQEGSVLAIEPMLAGGTAYSEVLEDNWTVVTEDGSPAAHWEHTVAATAAGPRILTTRPEGDFS
ncbi:type I methionyl aminopeptidase [Corynebacterium sp. TAE3-ERU2]|uniref:type I methionyl aminopeptidase n=1 Tax=Corynebacterium sp. TAE3-ERU2 TaxID=2849497 RepID=UPI001C49024E|nr:type I methionyl aminopeptidase [Corynebacterium sp. TAE3-ERU2]MBV7303049.1 type I methionyl aminopeptidase [Corynebacterium sp. TAE3-ERU2]